MKPGPPKTPTAIKLVTGNPGRRPLPKNEPKPPVAEPDPPDFLSDIAKTMWRHLCPKLAKVGLMTHIDIGVLTAYCSAWSDLVEATGKQAGKPTAVKTHNGNAVQSPYVSMIRQARLDLVRFAAELGMTPAARAGLDINVGSEAPPDTGKTGTTDYYAD